MTALYLNTKKLPNEVEEKFQDNSLVLCEPYRDWYIENKSELLKKQDTEYEKLDFVMNNFIHQRIKLKKIKNYYQGEVYHPFTNNQQFCYNFGPSGIVEQS